MMKRIWHRIGHGAGAALCLVAVLGFQHLADAPGWVSAAAVAGAGILWWRTRATLRMPLASLVLAAAMFAWLFALEPGRSCDWQTPVSVLPSFEIRGDRVTIHGYRDFRWREDGTCDARRETRVLRLDNLDELELVVEPFRDSERMAHTMLVFGFAGERVVLSVEARKEKDEEYGLIPGALRQFELIYVFGSEADLLGLRALSRGARLYLYPLRADRAFIRRLFLDLAQSAQALHDTPRFYRSIRDNCTTTLVKHVDRHLDRRIGLQLATLFPARTGRLMHELGYMKTDLPYPEAQRRFRIDNLVRTYANAPDISKKIRRNRAAHTSP